MVGLREGTTIPLGVNLQSNSWSKMQEIRFVWKIRKTKNGELSFLVPERVFKIRPILPSVGTTNVLDKITFRIKELKTLTVKIKNYSWIADQRDAHEKLICQRTRRVTIIPRPPLESSRRGEFRTFDYIFL